MVKFHFNHVRNQFGQEGIVLGNDGNKLKNNYCLIQDNHPQLKRRAKIHNDGISREDVDYIIDLFNNDRLGELEVIGTGSYSNVYGYKNYAIKMIKNENNEENRDIGVLKDISHLSCIPTLYATYGKKLIISERIIGKTVDQYRRTLDNPFNIDRTVIDRWSKALFDIVREGYSPDDLHEHNVMIDVQGEIKVVDVGWFFKHENDYDNFNVHSVKSDYGYRRAEGWAGDILRHYINRLEIKQEEDRKQRMMAINNYGRDFAVGGILGHVG